MDIKTKYSIGDLVQKKHLVFEEDSFQLLEVMDVETNTCYAGTQVFYQCRLYLIEKPSIYDINAKFWKLVNVSTTLLKFREDELIDALAESVKIFHNPKLEKK